MFSAKIIPSGDNPQVGIGIFGITCDLECLIKIKFILIFPVFIMFSNINKQGCVFINPGEKDSVTSVNSDSPY